MKKNRQQMNRGFSLIEIIVSLGIFMIVAVVATGTLLKVVEAGKKAQATKAVVNNLQFALESISREIRMGKKFHCDTNVNPSASSLIIPASCPNAANANAYLAFEPSTSRGGVNSNDRFAYRFVTQNVGGNVIGRIEKSDSNDGGIDDFYAITAPEVDIDDMRFIVSGAEAESSGTRYPTKVTLIIKGTVGAKDRLRSDFSLQTTITPRIRE